ARIDIRLDATGEQNVLEINVNPCLAPDAGFAMTAQQAGYTYDELIDALVISAAGQATKTEPLLPDTEASSDALSWRDSVKTADIERIRAIAEMTGVFTKAEIDIAAELVEERLSKGAASGYEFVLLESRGELMGYACYGLTPGTDASYDLYWIAVAPN